MEDGELVGAVREGNRQAYGVLVERYRQCILRLCYRVAGNLPDAEDLAHDAFVEAYLKLEQLRAPHRFAPWLKAVALNLCRTWYRRSRRADMELSEDYAKRPAEDGPATRLVCIGLTRLSAPHRLALALHYGEGLSYEEVAAFLDLPPGTVMSRLHRARHRLKQIMAQMRKDEEMTTTPEGEFGREVEAEIDALLALAGESSRIRERLSVLLRHSPERFAALIRQAEHAPALANLALLLLRAGRPAMEVVLDCYVSNDDVVAFTTDERTELRNTALRILGQLQRPAQSGRIRAALTHAEPSTRMAALRALADSADAEAGAHVMRAASSDDAMERRVAVEILGQLRILEAIPLLQARLDDSDRQVRRVAASAMGQLDSEEARAILRPLCQDPDKQLARAAISALHYAPASARPTPKQAQRPNTPQRPNTAEQRIRGDAKPPFFISLEAALRLLPDTQPCDEIAFSRRLARACVDYASARRYLVEDGLVQREGGIYLLTAAGEVAWRVERFLSVGYPYNLRPY